MSPNKKPAATRRRKPKRAKPKHSGADLWILGVGIRGIDQITLETLSVLKDCRIVLDLTHLEDELRKINPNTVDLDGVYWVDSEREDVYETLVETVLEEVGKGPGVALVSYGHPMVFDDVTLELVERCKKQGLDCRVLPGVSCLDTLCIDLGFDYGNGFQIFEATHLVYTDVPMNPNLHALVFQLGEFDNTRIAEEDPRPRQVLQPFVDYLLRFYDPKHRATIVFSDDGSLSKPKLLKTTVAKIASYHRSIFPGVSLYLPPLEDA